MLETGGPSLPDLAGFLLSLDVPFTVIDPPELRDVLLALADRCAAAGGNPPRPRAPR
ncbi:WYL domain-containing protein [Streptomyces zhaozhouensis]|uniref:WYL domain-containing protein n=1 Tax=Streptomyces zhaozhouensis TaxID=1300267 RepID=UPI001FE42D4B|nr:WYL domain-containing protein [Streptomyces zhaozhouensis]